MTEDKRHKLFGDDKFRQFEDIKKSCPPAIKQPPTDTPTDEELLVLEVSKILMDSNGIVFAGGAYKVDYRKLAQAILKAGFRR